MDFSSIPVSVFPKSYWLNPKFYISMITDKITP